MIFRNRLNQLNQLSQLLWVAEPAKPVVPIRQTTSQIARFVELIQTRLLRRGEQRLHTLS